MAKTDNLTVAELEKMLEDRRGELTGLHERRDELAAELAEVEGQIAELDGGTASSPAPRTRVARKQKPARTGVKRGRRKGQPSLKTVVLDQLERNKKGLRLDEMSEKVLATGYKTTATNFKANLYQALYNLKDQVDYDTEQKAYRLKQG